MSARPIPALTPGLIRSRTHRAANVVLSRLHRPGPLSHEALIAEAERRTGLRDWGGEEDFRDPLQILTESSNRSPATPVARLLQHRNLVDRLESRLRIADFIKRNPAVLNHPIEQPVFITGLPRTGTTLLQRLLARDPRTRTLRFWELITIGSPPGLLSGESRLSRSSRLALHHAALAILLSNAGRRQMRAVHEILPDEPEECIPLLLNTFVSEAYLMQNELPEYLEWLKARPVPSDYRYYRKQLQILTWGRRYKRLVVKCPLHLGHLTELLDVFPDARIIWTHRDPAKVLASNCSLLATFRAVRTDRVDPLLIGSRTVELAHWLLAGGAEASERPGRHRFLHILYRDLVTDPMQVASRIYEFLGQPLLPESEVLMRSWLEVERRARRPHHQYSLESFGLSHTQVTAEFGHYLEQFQVPKEDE